MTDVANEAASSGNGLSGLLKRGAAMSSIGLVICQVVTIIQTLVLGRILGPTEIGVFAAGTVAVGVVLVAHSTLAQALVQRDRDLEDAANTALVVTFATGLLLGLAVLAASPIIGDLFHSPRIGLIAAATSGLILLQSCASVPDAIMQRAFQFKRRLVIGPVVAMAMTSFSIVFAILGYGAWSMVIGMYASAVVALVLIWWMAKWRPFNGRFSFSIWREMAGFSLPLLFDGLAERAREAFEQVLVGRSLGTPDLGQFRYAYKIACIPTLAVVQVCAYVLFPAFARISGDAPRFREAYLRALGWMWFAILPVAAMLIATGEPIVVLLLGEEWRAAGSATAAMAGMGLGTVLISASWEAIKGASRPGLLNWLTALFLVLGPGLIVLLLPFGLTGIGVALSVTYLIVGLVSVQLARTVVDVSFRDTVACLTPQALAALPAFAVVFVLEKTVLRSDRLALPLGLSSVIMECVLFAVVFLSALRLTSPSRYHALRNGVERALKKLRSRVRQSEAVPNG